MRKTILLFSAFLMLACSSSDDNNSEVVNPENEINVPTWLTGLYKADNLFSQFPYPKSHAYSLNFSTNDIVVKGVATSETKSMKAFIDSLKTIDKLVSVEETSTANTYKIIVSYKNTESLAVDPDRFIYTIDPVEGVAGKINVEYYYVEKGSAYDYGTVRYTKQ
ncbi:hypothetical protein [Flavobacterium cerinum]|uniref:Lipoprotein n=1 Tax=Flavobacterium cerinum TaxID=2502784 RepID=A0A3S3S7W3_9FLAO|nr:hypothetical protein [Flavobacterium cerinum]RWW92348.1 hypothetical protein EPI11_15675 [Flavobacterium cerinum]